MTDLLKNNDPAVFKFIDDISPEIIARFLDWSLSTTSN